MEGWWKVKQYTAKQLEKISDSELRLLVIKIQEAHEKHLINIQNQHRQQLDLWYNANLAEKKALDFKATKKLLAEISAVQESWSAQLKELGFNVERESYY